VGNDGDVSDVLHIASFLLLQKIPQRYVFSAKKATCARSRETDNFFHFGLPEACRADFLPRQPPHFAKKLQLSVWRPPKIGLPRACRAENAIKRFIFRYTDNFFELCKKMKRYEKTVSLPSPDLRAGSVQPFGPAGDQLRELP
jgi:hypothetical protein